MKHKIYTRNDQKKEPLTPAARALVKRAVTAALDYEQFEGAAEVSVTFVDNEAIIVADKTEGIKTADEYKELITEALKIVK